MKMHLLDGMAEDEAIDLIARVTANLPIGASVGRVRCVGPTGLIADYEDTAAVYGIDTASDTWRVVDLDGGCRQERVTWRDGHELERVLYDVDRPSSGAVSA